MSYGICNENGDVIARFVVPTTLVSNQPVFATDTLSLHRKTTARGAQRWELTSNVEPLYNNAEALFVNLVRRGHHSEVWIKAPQNTGVIAKLRSVTGDNNVLTLDIGARSNVNGNGNLVITSTPAYTIPMGTLITLSGDNKVYMLLQDLVPGSLSISVYPEIRITAPSSGTMTYSGVKMRCLYDMDTIQGMMYQDGLLMDMGAIKFVEYL